ncbi:MAG: molybdenum cofactor biosynthesis protein [Solirubrobacterales bacterium]
MIRVEVKLFAILRERAGASTVEIELEDGATAGEARAAAAEVGGFSDLTPRLPIGVAVNRSYVGDDTPVLPGDEVVLIPPVSGGAPSRERGRPHARVTSEPLSLERVSGLVGDPSAGAVVTFQGVTREVERLDYEAYAEMASERIAEILAACTERHGLAAAAAEHRTGSVPLGEPSVIVACSSPHRGEAFAGAREAIDRIKAEAPIWKREIEGGEARWVEGTKPV